MAKIEGGCLCGKVRYTNDAEPVLVVNCYCKSCQQYTGGTHSYNYAMPAGSTKITGDTVKTYEDRAGASGSPFYRKFCSDCGSHFIGHGPTYEGLEFIRGGTIDKGHLEPTTHIWLDDKISWVAIPEGATTYAKNPG
jgi:hypothetical protein